MHKKYYDFLEEELEKNKKKSSKIDIWTSSFLIIFVVLLFVLLVLSYNPLIVSQSLLSSYCFFVIWYLYLNKGIENYFLQKENKILQRMIHTRNMIELDNLDKKSDIEINEFKKENN